RLGRERGGDARAQGREVERAETRERATRLVVRAGRRARARPLVGERRLDPQQRRLHALAHLGRRLLGERDRRDPLERGPAREHRVQDALDEEAGLAAAGAGGDAEVALEVGRGARARRSVAGPTRAHAGPPPPLLFVTLFWASAKKRACSGAASTRTRVGACAWRQARRNSQRLQRTN